MLQLIAEAGLASHNLFPVSTEVINILGWSRSFIAIMNQTTHGEMLQGSSDDLAWISNGLSYAVLTQINTHLSKVMMNKQKGTYQEHETEIELVSLG